MATKCLGIFMVFTGLLSILFVLYIAPDINAWNVNTRSSHDTFFSFLPPLMILIALFWSGLLMYKGFKLSRIEKIIEKFMDWIPIKNKKEVD